MKIIFLDIDGVLIKFGPDAEWNHEDFLQPASWNKDCLDFLDELCRVCSDRYNPVFVVISSTWRFHYKEVAWWKEAFKNYPNIRVIGITPRLSGIRGLEIESWLNDYAKPFDNNIKYVILDDDSDFLEHQKPFHIKCDCAKGFNEEAFDKAFKLL